MCISASIIRYEDLENPIEKYPKETELSTIKIGRLAVDRRYQKKGFGTQTLKKCISLFVEISRIIGVIGLTVDSKHESDEFYEKFGFIKLKPKKEKEYDPMILYTKTIKHLNRSLFEDPV